MNESGQVGTRKAGTRTIAASLVVGIVIAIGNPAVEHSQAGKSSGIPESAWGGPTDGIQSRLEIASTLTRDCVPQAVVWVCNARPSSRLPELPVLTLQLRNRGTQPVSFHYDLAFYSDIEVDGRWHAVPKGVSAETALFEVLPNTSSATYYLANDSFRTDKDKIGLTPGKHSIRLRTGSSRFSRGTQGRIVNVVSNFVTIEVLTRTADQERQTLIQQASSRGLARIGAAGRLVDKYPDAANDAVKAGLHVTSAPDQKVPENPNRVKFPTAP